MDEKIYISGMQKKGEYVYVKPAYSFGEKMWEYVDKLKGRKGIEEIEEIFSDGIIRLKIKNDDILEIFKFTEHLESKSNLYLVYERVNLNNNKLLLIKPRNPLAYGEIMRNLSKVFNGNVHVSICERPKVIKQNKNIPKIHINPDLEEEDYKEYVRERFQGKKLKNMEVETKKDEIPNLIEKINKEFEIELPPIYVSDGEVLIVILLHKNEIRVSSGNYENVRDKLTKENQNDENLKKLQE